MPHVMPPIICERAVFGIEDAAGREHAEHASNTHLAGVPMHRRFREMRAEAGVRVARCRASAGVTEPSASVIPEGEAGLEFPTGGREPPRRTSPPQTSRPSRRWAESGYRQGER